MTIFLQVAFLIFIFFSSSLKAAPLSQCEKALAPLERIQWLKPNQTEAIDVASASYPLRVLTLKQRNKIQDVIILIGVGSELNLEESAAMYLAQQFKTRGIESIQDPNFGSRLIQVYQRLFRRLPSLVKRGLLRPHYTSVLNNAVARQFARSFQGPFNRPQIYWLEQGAHAQPDRTRSWAYYHGFANISCLVVSAICAATLDFENSWDWFRLYIADTLYLAITAPLADRNSDRRGEDIFDHLFHFRFGIIHSRDELMVSNMIHRFKTPNDPFLAIVSRDHVPGITDLLLQQGYEIRFESEN